MDYGRFKYKQTKKEKEAKKKQHVVKVKEVKIRPQIEEHDYKVKLDNSKKFLEKGNKVKLTLLFRGREMAHKEIGEALLKKFCGEILESKLGAVEAEAKLFGKAITLVMSPLKIH
jgi:translation initiation factor IF-3